MSGARITVEVEGVKETEQGLDRTGDALKSDDAQRKAAENACSDLSRAFMEAASRSPTPQAASVAGALLVRGELAAAAVAVDSGRVVVSGGGSAGELLYGSEHGGTNFAAPRNAGGYWIAPTIAAHGERLAAQRFQELADEAIRAGGF